MVMPVAREGAVASMSYVGICAMLRLAGAEHRGCTQQAQTGVTLPRVDADDIHKLINTILNLCMVWLQTRKSAFECVATLMPEDPMAYAQPERTLTFDLGSGLFVSPVPAHTGLDALLAEEEEVDWHKGVWGLADIAEESRSTNGHALWRSHT